MRTAMASMSRSARATFGCLIALACIGLNACFPFGHGCTLRGASPAAAPLLQRPVEPASDAVPPPTAAGVEPVFTVVPVGLRLLAPDVLAVDLFIAARCPREAKGPAAAVSGDEHAPTAHESVLSQLGFAAFRLCESSGVMKALEIRDAESRVVRISPLPRSRLGDPSFNARAIPFTEAQQRELPSRAHEVRLVQALVVQLDQPGQVTPGLWSVRVTNAFFTHERRALELVDAPCDIDEAWHDLPLIVTPGEAIDPRHAPPPFEPMP